MRNRLRLLLPLLALALVASCNDKRTGDAATSTLDKVKKRGTLIVGCEPEFAPFESKNEKGEYVGFDMDMARELAKDLGVKLKIVEMKWTSLPTALGTGEIDIIISGMTATAERAKSRTFTEPYFLTGLCLLVNARSGIKTAADVGNKKLVVKQGTTGDINAKKLFPEATVIQLQKEADCALDVVNGRADAFLYDQLSILRHHKAHPEATRALLKPLTKEPYAMAIKKGDTTFVARLNQFLADMKKDGRMKALRTKYFSELPDDAK